MIFLSLIFIIWYFNIFEYIPHVWNKLFDFCPHLYDFKSFNQHKRQKRTNKIRIKIRNINNIWMQNSGSIEIFSLHLKLLFNIKYISLWWRHNQLLAEYFDLVLLCLLMVVEFEYFNKEIQLKYNILASFTFILFQTSILVVHKIWSHVMYLLFNIPHLNP